jgi:ankyrin repeat protein
MSAPDAPRRELPAHPSKEHLRKQAKRLAKSASLQLAAAQRALAREYGFANWSALMREVERRAPQALSPITRAAGRADVVAVRALLEQGADVEGEAHEIDSPLFAVCDSGAAAADRLQVARVLIEAGAFTRRGCTNGATPLHAAARRGPAALVEILLRNGALFWQGDAKNKRPYDYAKEGAPQDRERLLFLLADGPRISDPNFRAAIEAIKTGDAASLSTLLDAHPSLLSERAIEPDIGPRGYFSDPKLFWFIANNPTLAECSPPNIVEIAKLMIDRSVAQEDLDYALELVATNMQMPPEQQVALVALLASTGAHPGNMLMSLGHQQTAPSAWLVDNGVIPITAPIAAGLGRSDVLSGLLAAGSDGERSDALAMAVINGEHGAACLCLENGADPNRFMPCHTHSTPLHQAAGEGDVAMMDLLIAHGARLDTPDKLWRGTPLGWALHGKHEEAAAFLRARMSQTED